MRKLCMSILSVVVSVSVGIVVSAANDNLIYGCKHKQNGKVRIVTTMDQCKTTEIAMSWNQEGPQGEKGDPGAQGDVGPQGPPGPQGE